MKYRRSKQKGFTLVEIMIAVVLIGLLAGIAVPNFVKGRATAQKNVCINNLRTIDYAIQQWAMESKKAANSPVQFSDISDYLRQSVICPSGGASFDDSYAISVVGVEPGCQRSPASHFIDQLVANGDPAPSVTSSTPTDSSHSNNGLANGHSNGNNGNGKGGNKP
jgi:prepilin-type N-terminal cleavage/methylation domain-containing protein